MWTFSFEKKYHPISSIRFAGTTKYNLNFSEFSWKNEKKGEKRYDYDI